MVTEFPRGVLFHSLQLSSHGICKLLCENFILTHAHMPGHTCTHMHTHVQMHTFTLIPLYTYRLTNTDSYTYANMDTHAHTCTHSFRHTHPHPYAWTHIDTLIQTYTYKGTHAHSHIQPFLPFTRNATAIFNFFHLFAHATPTLSLSTLCTSFFSAWDPLSSCPGLMVTAFPSSLGHLGASRHHFCCMCTCLFGDTHCALLQLFHKGRDFCLLCSMLCPQSLGSTPGRCANILF